MVLWALPRESISLEKWNQWPVGKDASAQISVGCLGPETMEVSAAFHAEEAIFPLQHRISMGPGREYSGPDRALYP